MPNAKAEKSTRRGERDKRGKREQKLSRVNVLNGGAGESNSAHGREVQNGAAGEQPEKTAGGGAYTRTHHECGGWQGANNNFGIGRKTEMHIAEMRRRGAWRLKLRGRGKQ